MWPRSGRETSGWVRSTRAGHATCAPTSRSARTRAQPGRGRDRASAGGALLRTQADQGGDRVRRGGRHRDPPQLRLLPRLDDPRNAPGEALPSRDRAQAPARGLGPRAWLEAGVDPAGEAAPGGPLRRVRATRPAVDRAPAEPCLTRRDAMRYNAM